MRRVQVMLGCQSSSAVGTKFQIKNREWRNNQLVRNSRAFMHELGHDCVMDRPPYMDETTPSPLPTQGWSPHLSAHSGFTSSKSQCRAAIASQSFSSRPQHDKHDRTCLRWHNQILQRHLINSLPAASRRSASNVPRPVQATLRWLSLSVCSIRSWSTSDFGKICHQYPVLCWTWEEAGNAGIHNNKKKTVFALDWLDDFSAQLLTQAGDLKSTMLFHFLASGKKNARRRAILVTF